MSTNRIPMAWMTVWATDDNTSVFHPTTPWIEAADVQFARTAWEISTIGAELEIAPAWQVANTEDVPGAFKQLVAPASTVDVRYPADWTNILGDPTAPSKGNMLIRFGWQAKTTPTNPGLALATVAGVVEYQMR